MHTKHKLAKFAPLLLFAALTVLLTACPGVSGGNNGNNSGAPQITSFTASQSNVAAGTPVTLNWVITGVPTSLSLKGSDGTNLSSISGTNTTVTPNVTTTYTLTATNSSGSDDEMTIVTVGGTGPVTPPGGSSTLSFGVSGTQDGDFQNDAGGNITAGDPRIVNVSAGSTFYAQVTYSGPAPVNGVTVYLANSSPAGFRSDLVTGTDVKGFTLGEAVGTCPVDGTQTSLTCVYPVSVASGTPNITGLDGSGSEFAYVLRARVTDTTGATNMDAVRGYVTVGGSSGGGGTPNPPPTDPNPPTDPPTDPPANKAPTVSITITSGQSSPTSDPVMLELVDGTATQAFEAKGSDPDSGDTISYEWDVDTTTGEAVLTQTGSKASVKFTADVTSTYTVKVTITDSKKATGTASKEVIVTVGGGTGSGGS